MCGRYVITSPVEAIARMFGAAERPNFAARYNVAPSQSVPVVRRAAAGSSRRLALLRWGLIPHWAAHPFARGGIAAATLINARADSVAHKPAFRAAFEGRRCLMPADAFYEWREDVTPKQPYRIGLAGWPLFAIAGLWASWSGAPKPGAAVQTLESCALITTAASPAITHIHHRMPVILARADWETWLDPTTPVATLAALLRPAEAALAWHPVGRAVNAVANDTADLLDPVPEPEPTTSTPASTPAPVPAQGQLFG